jgi:hypothetical protein
MFFAATIGKMKLSAVSDPSAAIATTLSNDTKSNVSSASDAKSYTGSDSKSKDSARDDDATKAKLVD